MSKRNTKYEIRNTYRVYVVILVGGMGKRLQPLSTNEHPKAFLSVMRNGRTMFSATLDRALKLTRPSNIIVVANKAHAGLVKKDFPGIPERNLILESVSRNTAPAMALAVSDIYRRDPAAIIAGIWSDQYITDEAAYIESLKNGVSFVKANPGALVVLGIKPRFPSTELGYIKTRYAVRRTQYGSVFKVAIFVEKPGLAVAKRFVKSGRYLWHAGGLVFRAGSILRAYKKYAPAITDIINAPGDLSRRFKEMPDIAIDRAIIEKSDKVYCVQGSYGWVDMGSFVSLRSILEREGRKFVLKDGKIVKIL